MSWPPISLLRLICNRVKAIGYRTGNEYRCLLKNHVRLVLIIRPLIKPNPEQTLQILKTRQEDGWPNTGQAFCIDMKVMSFNTENRHLINLASCIR